MFGVVPKTIWNNLNPADDNNLCTWALRCLLIEDGSRLILIDNGVGNKQDAKFFSHYSLHGQDTLDQSLKRHGFRREDITDVLLTHLHFDHCGGSVERKGELLVPAFPKARYWSNQPHWQWATNPNAREKASFLKENILPLQTQGCLDFIATPEILATDNVLPSRWFTDTVSIRFVNGHTHGMMLPQITYKGRTIVYMADLIPSAGHVPIPYVMAYDMFPLTTLEEKKQLLDEALAGDYILFFEHDPVNECCSLIQTEKGIRPKQLFRLDEI